MRALLIVSLIALAACTGAQQQTSSYSKNEATACIDVDGSQLPVSCRKYESDITGPKDEGYCVCPVPSMRVTAEFWVKGEPVPTETNAYRDAVRAASRDGSLVGDRFDGRRMCIARGYT